LRRNESQKGMNQTFGHSSEMNASYERMLEIINSDVKILRPGQSTQDQIGVFRDKKGETTKLVSIRQK